MARAHRLSGYDSDEEDDEFDELQEKLKEHPEDLVKQKNNYFNFSYYFSLSLSLLDNPQKVVEKYINFGMLGYGLMLLFFVALYQDECSGLSQVLLDRLRLRFHFN